MTSNGSKRPLTLPNGSVITLYRRTARITISVKPNGQYYVNGTRVHKAEILSLLRKQAKRDPKTTVILNCDESRVPRGTLIDMVDLVRQANLSGHILLKDEPPTQKAKPASGALVRQPTHHR